MAIRVYTNSAQTAASRGYIDYPDAVAYEVDSAHELDILTADGSRVATYAPGSWHHVETGKGQ